MKKDSPDTNTSRMPEDAQKTLAETSKELADDIKKKADEAKETAKQTADKTKETVKNAGVKTKQGFDNGVVKTKKTAHTGINRIAWLAVGFLLGIIVAFTFILIGRFSNSVPEVEEVTTLDITTAQQSVEP